MPRKGGWISWSGVGTQPHFHGGARASPHLTAVIRELEQLAAEWS